MTQLCSGRDTYPETTNFTLSAANCHYDTPAELPGRKHLLHLQSGRSCPRCWFVGLVDFNDRTALPPTRCHNTGADLRFVLAAGCGMFIIGLIGCGRGNAPTTRVGAARSTTVNGSSDPSPAAPAHTPGTNYFADESGLALLRKGSPSWFTDRDDPSSDGWDSEVFSQRASLSPRYPCVFA